LEFEFVGWKIAERRVKSLCVADLLDEPWKAVGDIPEGLVAADIDVLDLERLHEALGLRIVVTGYRVMHFTRTSASWSNMVERFFRDITDKRIRRDSFTSVAELELAIDLYAAHHSIDPKPFIWTAPATDILAKVTRAKAALTASAG
jgi:hypothetical protein